MKLLVLGNGFDIDHNLPTSYKSFLNFCNAVMNRGASFEEKLSEKQKEYLVALESSDLIRNNFMKLLQKNYFLTYFNKRIEKTGENWIDFEREISVIVGTFDAVEAEFQKSKNISISIEKDSLFNEILKDMGLSPIIKKNWNEICFNVLHKSIDHHYNNFASALDYYISAFINKTKCIGVSPDVIEFDADRVLTFNYSKTYENVYGKARVYNQVAHAHGIAEGDLNAESRIVLGITSSRNENYVNFEKYYQRITKRTGNKYLEWISDASASKSTSQVLFFGHSLDSSDSDIIKELLINPHFVVTILYHDDKAYQQIVRNIITILGKGQFVTLVSGNAPKIRFAQQRAHCDSSDCGMEIKGDINTFYHLYQYSSSFVDEFIDKILLKIKSKDKSYFYSQENVISMAEAIYDCKKINVDVADFLKISNLLPYSVVNNTLNIFSSEYWLGEDCAGNEIYVCHQTQELIDKINEENKKRFLEDHTDTTLLKIQTADSIDEIISQLDTLLDENPSEILWKELKYIVSEMTGNDLFDAAIAKIKSQDYSTVGKSIRARHLCDIAYEEGYYYWQQQQYEEYLKEQEDAN